MSDQNKRPNDSFADDEPIVAVDFAPLQTERQGLRLPVTRTGVIVGSVLLVFASISWFVLTARSVYFDVEPAPDAVSVSGGLAVKMGQRFLIREGEVAVTASAAGYHDYTGTVTIGEDAIQTFAIDMEPLPGFLDLDTGGVSGAEVVVDGTVAGTTPLKQLELTAGEHLLVLRNPRYEVLETSVIIEGRSTSQSLSLELVPAWADVGFTTTPAGATVTIDGAEVGQTPLTTEVLGGNHEVIVKLAAHKAWTNRLSVTARENITVPPITLEPADGLVMLRSAPGGANVTVDGTFRGQTPVELSLAPGRNHNVVFFLNGYQEANRSVRTDAADESTVAVTLEPITSSVRISATPADAELYINGQLRGRADQEIELLAASQTIEIRKDGYVPYSTTFISRPGLAQQLVVSLKTLEQQRQDNIKPEIAVSGGLKLKLIYPGNFTLGASRREAGRQANEVLRNVSLTKPFYMSLTEVTNDQFALFDMEHSSGVVEGRTLANPTQPVVQVTWEQAAMYCNWLSQQEGLQAFYVVDGDKITGVNADSTGYRLPTEAEWDWVARVNGDPASLLRFPWGAELPPPANQGNYADISAGNFLGRILLDYDDGYMGTAPVASFPANGNGFYDIGGNVAEWVHDWYGTVGTVGTEVQQNPLGPTSGTYHVIKGSSWAHGTVTELRLSFRDYHNTARDDVGFRVARYLGE